MLARRSGGEVVLQEELSQCKPKLVVKNIVGQLQHGKRCVFGWPITVNQRGWWRLDKQKRLLRGKYCAN